MNFGLKLFFAKYYIKMPGDVIIFPHIVIFLGDRSQHQRTGLTSEAKSFRRFLNTWFPFASYDYRTTENTDRLQQ